MMQLVKLWHHAADNAVSSPGHAWFSLLCHSCSCGYVSLAHVVPCVHIYVVQAIATQPLELPDHVTISPHLRDLFMRLFDKDPDTRITLQVSSQAATVSATVARFVKVQVH